MRLEPQKERIRDSKYFKIALYAFFTISGCLIFFHILNNMNKVGSSVSTLLSILSPFIAGGVLAYLLNPLLRFFERHLASKVHNQKLLRTIGILLTFLCAFLVLWTILGIILPKVYVSARDLFDILKVYINRAYVWVIDFLENSSLEEFLTPNQVEELYKSMGSMVGKIYGMLQQAIPWVLGFTGSITKLLLNAVLGIIVSIYLLYGKERFAGQATKITYAVLKSSNADKVLDFMRLTDDVFSQYVVGQLLDAGIVGILCFLGMTIFGMPYTLLISVLVAVTNIIPYFGPFLGAIPACLILLTVSPAYCFGFALFILFLQQLDGNIIKPKILGSSTGLSGIWILFSVTVGGSLFGVLGMLLGVPVFAILYSGVVYWTNKKLTKKGLPIATSHYLPQPPKPKEKKKKKK